ncbi:MAG: putative thioredoxin [Microbacteriaceae bacterium]|nr:putative thioredoxin [Microbacteriaceae bacterium]
MTSIPPSAANLRGAVDLSSLVRPPAAAGAGPAGQSGPVAVPSLVVEGTDASFTGILDLSQTVPVIVELYVGQPSADLIRVVTGYAGRLVLATVDAAANPQLTQAFRAVAAPTVAAVIGGRPIALYEGELPQDDVKQVLDQVLTLAAQQNVTGTVTPQETEAASAEPIEEPLPPHHQEAFDAIAAGDFETAIKEYRTAIAQDPRDQLAVAGLAQVSLLARLDGVSAADIRQAAGSAPADLDAQLAVADLDVSGGHLEDAFGRLLDLFPSLDQAGKDRVRTRLLEYFEIAGTEDPRVTAARRRLTALLY